MSLLGSVFRAQMAASGAARKAVTPLQAVVSPDQVGV